ncbi:hypothetical protein [Mucilaginibacter sp. CSA2-8R]|uniref:hypothetical protein n=1 Tax=Mucilaginibacter sp. CSA2-8R TaxID=3141542 RepID=UPI00315CE995
MKYFLFTLSLSASLSAFSQVKVVQGSNSPDFQTPKPIKFSSFSNGDTDYFVFKRPENVNTYIVADKTGNITVDKDIQVIPGVMGNSYEVQNLLVVGSTPYVFVENHVKDGGTNTMVARTIDKSGNISATGVTIGTINFTKLSAAGDWYTCLTPDKKHVAIISKAPYEKGQPQQFNYYLLDEQMKEVNKGQFAYQGVDKRISVFGFTASDKGDIYILSEEFDKTYKFPVLYKYTAGGQASIIPVMMADPGLKNLSYTYKVNPEGELVIAGYMQQKKTFTMGDVAAIGTWTFNSSKPDEVKTFNFDKPITNLTARNIVYNGDTFYLIGEQYKSERESRIVNTSLNGLVDNYSYTHEDIMVTGFNTAGNKKFDIPISRKWGVQSTDPDLMVASGVINNKLALVYNDQYGKYVEGRYYKNYKLPVSVLVTNDGLMEAPVTYAKDFNVINSGLTLNPQFFTTSNGKISVLSVGSQSVKAASFQ